jgi:uncharacterized delta-60 repeat protein
MQRQSSAGQRPFFGQRFISFLYFTHSSVAIQDLPSPQSPVHVPASGSISAFAVEPDGKIVVGGSFTNLSGQVRNHIGRLNSDGTLDPFFNSTLAWSVTALLVQLDGKTVVAGVAVPFAGVNIVRVKPDGTADSGFHVTANDTVNCLALQADGKILVGGAFTTVGGVPRTGIARLNTNGTLDTTFNVSITETGPIEQTSPEVTSVAVQPDGGILVGGIFMSVNGTGRTNICRLNANGTLDVSFMSPPPEKVSVQCLLLQPDGKVLVGFSSLTGAFIVYTGTNYLLRLNSDGSLDSNFASGFNDQITSLGLQCDGKILASGMFTHCDGSLRTNVSRLNADGTLDTGFNTRISYSGGFGSPTADFTMAIQNDGKLLLGANFTRFTPRTNYLTRFRNTDSATDAMSFDGTTITWSRDGTAPEVWRTTFDACTNGADWVALGDGARISGGWQITGLALPGNTPIRARGFLTGGANNGSSWYVESTLNLTLPPIIITDDSGFGVRSNQFSFNIAAVPDQIVVIEASTDLQNWSPLSTNTLYSSPLRFTDPSPTVVPCRFYRARLQ